MPVVEYVLKGDTKGVTTAFRGAAVAATAALAAVALLTKAYIKLVTETVAVVDSVHTLAKATGLATETINGLRLAAKASGKALEDIVPQKLAKNMLAAADSGGAMADAFGRIGVEFQTSSGELRNADEVFKELIDGLSDMENRTEAAAIAALILGKNGKELLSAFDDTEGLETFIELGNEFGIKTGPKAAEAASEWQRATAGLALAFENVGSSLLETLGGTSAFSDLIRINSLKLIVMTELIQTFAQEASKSFIQLAQVIVLTLRGEADAAEAIAGQIKGITTIANESFDSSVKAGKLFWKSFQQGIKESAAEVGDSDDEDGTLRGNLGGLKVVIEELAGTIGLVELLELSDQMDAEKVELYVDSIAALADEMARAEQASADMRQGIIDDLKDLSGSFEDELGDIGDAYKAMGQNLSSALDDTLGMLEAMGLEGSAAYKALFVIQKAAAIAGVTVDTARAVMGALAAAPGPIGIALGATMAIAGAAQIANIVATSIGSSGGISSPSGGGSAAVDRADTLKEQAIAGAPGGGGGGGGIPWEAPGGGSNRDRFVVMQFRHEIYDVTVPDSVRIPGSALSRVQKNGARVGQRGVSGRPRKLLTT